MIKRFESFNNDIKVEDFLDAFAEFIDEGADYEHCMEYEGDQSPYFQIFIDVPFINLDNLVTFESDNTIKDINYYINRTKEQLDVFEDINVCIKRIYDKYQIYPNIDEEDFRDNRLVLNILYEFNK